MNAIPDFEKEARVGARTGIVGSMSGPVLRMEEALNLARRMFAAGMRYVIEGCDVPGVADKVCEEADRIERGEK